MTIQRFSLTAVQQVRQYIQSAIVIETDKQSQVWTGLDDAAEVPEPKSLDDLSGVFTFGGLSSEEISPLSQPRWAISTVNPGAALLKLPGLRLKPGWRLTGYVYQDGKNGVGLVFALPEALATTALLEKALTTSSGLKQPPKPEGCSPDFMEAVEGDRSAVSFVVASLLYRELREFGVIGQYRSWANHRLIDAVPPQAKWQWQTEQPKDLAPKVKLLPDGQAIVEFFSCRVSAGVAIYRHVDQYLPMQYKLKRMDKPLATLQR